MTRRRLTRLVLLRFAAAVAIFTVSMLPVTRVQDVYAGFFRTAFPPFLNGLFSGIDVRMQPHEARGGVHSTASMLDSEMVIVNRNVRVEGGYPQGNQPVSSQWLGCVPTALFLALVLPTPIPWKRRRRALVFGLLLVQLFVFLRLTLALLDAISRPTPLARFHPSEFWWNVLSFFNEAVTKEVFPGFLAPFLIWALVSFRRGDYGAVMLGESDPSP